VAVDGTGVEPVADRAGAPPDAPGTLLEVPLPSCVPAGTAVTADLTFELTLGPGTDERVGTSSSGDLAWFGTAYPLLAWVSGRGWARDAAVDVTGEMAVSEQFQLASLTVVAPSRYAVLGVGEKVGEDVGAESGLTTHRFAASAVRDVTVTVGRLQTIDVDVNGTRVHLGVSPGARAPVSVWQRTVVRRLERVSEYLGPVPVDDLWVSVIPDQTEGIEFPGALQVGDLSLPEDAWVVTHELAHLWFYGLVGNNQARDPWLDEAFASFVEDLIENADSGPTPQDVPDRVADRVGRPMAYWAELRRPSTAYIDGVYVAGAVALMEARRRAGPAAFDDALRDYLSENAHTIARPEDVEEAFAHLPEALEVLRDAGALDRAAAG
jgi:hypothetical protein